MRNFYKRLRTSLRLDDASRREGGAPDHDLELVDRQLRASAVGCSPPVDLHARIMGGVRAAGRGEKATPWTRSFGLRLGVTAAAALAVASAGWWQTNRAGEGMLPSAMLTTASEALALGEKVAMETPSVSLQALESEMTKVRSDMARAAEELLAAIP